MSEALIRRANGEFTEAMEAALPQTLDLEIDVMFHNQRVTRLHLEEPTAGQYEKATAELVNGPNAHSMERFKVSLIAAVAKVDRSVVLGMKKSQVEEAFDFLSRLLDAGRPTGAT